MAPLPDGAPLDVTVLDEPETHPWKVEDEGGANWALRKLGQARAELARIDEMRQEEQTRLDEWVEASSRGPRSTERFMETRLLAFFRARLIEDPKTRTLHTPGGDLKATKSTTLTVNDQDAVIAFLRASGRDELVKVETSVGKQVVKDLLRKDDDGNLIAVTKDGEPVPGIAIDIDDNLKAIPS
jgi:phage host-nuclease inhibitor protein Gam